jgi:uncharacterized protein (DUF2236 family)
LRERAAAATSGLFAHAPYPLADSLSYGGDPGLFGPESVTWPVIGDVATMIGGIRALLIQAAHPEVAAGVAEHSRYREDPLGRLSRTSAYVTATAFGAMPEVEHAVRAVRRAHRPVTGMSSRGRGYRADQPDLAAWVHNALTDSFLVAYRLFGPRPLPPGGADRFVAEQTRVGALLDAAPLPETAAGISAWIVDHPDLARSPGMAESVAFLRSPPLPAIMRGPYRVLYWAAAASLPERLRVILDLRDVPGAVPAGRAATRFLRWVLGASPSWHLGLVRVGAPIPDGLFKRTIATSANARRK